MALSHATIDKLSDSKNTHVIKLYFKGCPVTLNFVGIDTSINIVATYPFDLNIFTIKDTFYQCGNPLPLVIVDSLYLSASQILNVNDLDEGNDLIRISPNPSNDIVLIDFTSLDGEKTMQLIDINGQKIGEEVSTTESSFYSECFEFRYSNLFNADTNC